jgi:hypothetical protein
MNRRPVGAYLRYLTLASRSRRLPRDTQWRYVSFLFSARVRRGEGEHSPQEDFDSRCDVRVKSQRKAEGGRGSAEISICSSSRKSCSLKSADSRHRDDQPSRYFNADSSYEHARARAHFRSPFFGRNLITVRAQYSTRF